MRSAPGEAKDRGSIVFTFDGVEICSKSWSVNGYGLANGRVAADRNLLWWKDGASLTSRPTQTASQQAIAAVPDDQPVGIELSPGFEKDGAIYQASIGIGGLARKDWSGAPIARDVAEDMAYALAKDPKTPAAYVQLSIRDKDGKRVDYRGKSGKVSFDEYQLDKHRFKGAVDATFVPVLGDGQPVAVKGTFDIRTYD